uniref:HAD family hydrolase n=1 Tax=Gelidibacter sp. TaxID=2018083 RepID=UPI00404A1BF3
MSKSKLIILDLDHTLILGSFADQESAKLLFQFSKYIKVYERPYGRDLISKCASIGDIMVYTTALSDYAKKICKHLNINAIALYTRGYCKRKGFDYTKVIPESIYAKYDEIIIIDDMPSVWDTRAHQTCQILVPSKFMGDIKDEGLLKILDNPLLSHH